MVHSHGKTHSESSTNPSVFEFTSKEKRQEKGKVCFGSGLERRTLESDTRGLVSKHARTYTKQRLDIAPGMYNIPQASSMNDLLTKPTSKLGTVLGGRKAPRLFNVSHVETPAPGAYKIPSMFPEEFSPSCAPFNTSTERAGITSNTPGVGTYNVGVYKRRRVDFKHSFGGKMCLQPSVRMKCGPFNFDKCERCQKYPEGDYWYIECIVREVKKGKSGNIDVKYLCRPCYELEKKDNSIFPKEQMQFFKKIRDCSKVHFHDGCKGKLFLVPPQEIAKLKEREGYLSLFFK